MDLRSVGRCCTNGSHRHNPALLNADRYSAISVRTHEVVAYELAGNKRLAEFSC
jgi:hypothetical protein